MIPNTVEISHLREKMVEKSNWDSKSLILQIVEDLIATDNFYKEAKITQN